MKIHNCGLACSKGATDSCKVGAMGSIPIRSTETTGSWSSAYGSMVKRTSCLVSNEKFRVRVVVGPLEKNRKRKGYPIGDGARLEAGRAMSLAGSTPAPSAKMIMVSVVYVVGTPACEAGGKGSTPFGHPLKPTWLDIERHRSCKAAHAGANPVVGSQRAVSNQPSAVSQTQAS